MQQSKNVETVKPYHNNVRKVIKQQGYTIQEVADEIGISRRTLTNYVTGTSPIPRAYLEKIAYTIGCDVEDLMARPTQSAEQKTASTHTTTTPDNQTSPIILLTDEQKALLKSLLDMDEDLLTQKIEHISNTTIARRTLLQDMLSMMGLALTLAPGSQPPIEHSKNVISEDLIMLFENNMAAHWELYHTGGAARIAQGLDAWVKEIARLTQLAEETNWHQRTMTLLTMSYQLQSCALRDMMDYTKSHMAYQKAFHIAQELDDSELMSSALARQGVTLIQQQRPKEAIIYLSGALDITDAHSYPLLRGHTLQALAEAYAMAQQPQESWESIGQAENYLRSKEHSLERSLTRGVTIASVAAQKGVNAFLLHNSQEAVQLIDRSLATYDPALIRGRARLIAQRAEAYYELGVIDACSSDALTALSLARSAGSNKTEARVKTLYTTLVQSQWGKEQSIIQLGNALSLE